MKQLFTYIFLNFFVLVSIFSCVEDIDVDQFDTLDINPTVEASLLYVEASEGLIDLVSGNTVFSNNFNFDAFSSAAFSERVIDGSISYEVENTTNKALEITLDFLNENGVTLDTEIFEIEAAPISIIQREILYGSSGRSIEIIKSLSSIQVSAVNLNNDGSASTELEPKITLKSSGKFTLRIK